MGLQPNTEQFTHGSRAWKGLDFEVMGRLNAQGLIDDPKSKAKSVWLSPEDLEHGRSNAERLFGGSSAGGA